MWGLRPDFYTVRQLQVCWCGVLSLTRERVCRLQLLLVLASAVILRSESRVTRDCILLSQIWDSPNLEDQVPVFISLRNRVGQLYPQALGSLFVASCDSQGYNGGIRTRLHAGVSVYKRPSSSPINLRNGPRTENTAPLLCDVTTYAEMCLLSRCLTMNIYCCHALKRGIYRPVA
jgi:hypothetical protein